MCECGLLIPIPNGNFGENAYYPNVDANQPRAPGPLDVAIRSTLTMFSPRLGMTLSSGKGKYWRWAGAITPDSLEALLLAVGEFAQHWQGTRLPDGSLPAPRFYPHRMDEKRMRTALEVFALLHSTGGAEQRPETKTIGGWPFDLSHEMPGLTQVYQERLSSHTSTHGQFLSMNAIWEFSFGMLASMAFAQIRVRALTGANIRRRLSMRLRSTLDRCEPRSGLLHTSSVVTPSPSPKPDSA